MLVLWNGNGTGSFLHSREGGPQGEPLAIITYGIGIFPLVKNPRRYIPEVTQPWYSDYDRSLGTFIIIETYFNFLTHQVPGRRYHPEPFKSVHIVHMENIKAGKVFREHHGFKVCKCKRYLGCCIGDDEPKHD